MAMRMRTAIRLGVVFCLALGSAAPLPASLFRSFRGEIQSILADFETGEGLRLEGKTAQALKVTNAAAKRLNAVSFGLFSSYSMLWTELLWGRGSLEDLRKCMEEVLLSGVVAQKAVDYERSLGNERYALTASNMYDYWVSTYNNDLQLKKQLLEAPLSMAKNKQELLEFIDQQLTVFETAKSLPPEDLEMMRYQLLEQLKGSD
jgi:hypothetical protein